MQRCGSMPEYTWGNSGVKGRAVGDVGENWAERRLFIHSTTIYPTPTMCQAVFKTARYDCEWDRMVPAFIGLRVTEVDRQ